MILRILAAFGRLALAARGPAVPFDPDPRVRPGAYALLGGVARR